MNNVTTLLFAASAFGSFDYSNFDLPRGKYEPGRVIWSGRKPYRRPFGDGHSKVERQMRRDARRARLAEVKARN